MKLKQITQATFEKFNGSSIKIAKGLINPDDSRDSKGYFAPGNTIGLNVGQGRKPGTKERINNLRDAFLTIFESNGYELPLELIDRLRDEKPEHVLGFISKLLPKEIDLSSNTAFAPILINIEAQKNASSNEATSVVETKIVEG